MQTELLFFTALLAIFCGCNLYQFFLRGELLNLLTGILCGIVSGWNFAQWVNY